MAASDGRPVEPPITRETRPVMPAEAASLDDLPLTVGHGRLKITTHGLGRLGQTAAVIVVGLVVVALAAAVGAVLAGRAGAYVAALVGEVAVAVFATTRAYACGEKRPLVTSGLAAVVFTIVPTLAYLGWRWSGLALIEGGGDG